MVRSASATKDRPRSGPWSDRWRPARPLAAWRRLGTARQFLLLAAVLLALFVAIGGVLQSRLVRAEALAEHARTASVYMQGIISPHVQSLGASPWLSRQEQSRLDTLVADTGLGREIEAIKIWRPDGTIVYSTDPRIIGERHESESVAKAARGETVENHGTGTEHAGGGETAGDLFEIYIPIRGSGGEIIAVGEFYQRSDGVAGSLATVIAGSWAIRVMLAMGALALLSIVVLGADARITAQRRANRQHHRRNLELLKQNRVLRNEAERSRRLGAQASEDLLGRVGADLHDGPVQLLTLAALHADRPSKAMPLLQTAMDELRCIAAGLVLPELCGLTASDALRLAVARHERNTGTRVETDISDLPATISHELKACMYRIVQEALQNAVRHAGAQGQRVEARCETGMIRIAVSDTGPGKAEAAGDEHRPKLGLVAARNRAAAFKGSFAMQQRRGGGTEVIARFPPDLDPTP
ncbi:hypothetical protein U0C82_06395 [Fulvimarina sp. 2208YS6-2-32]|uniref:Histidine kinase/HSP90-like ATPase domain-containing protein n=1 Tax=Fulvimarina uroteuthidis TaxID=3098149 RepID=A0ABU5I1X6_9HYPH|nr:ATP-binding protein [Fulvimarina sp. 2208YS6-2-32]MDY8108773.1 hypothetical protein [Fulvimarina sp. 2208YS6-2-32]